MLSKKSIAILGVAQALSLTNAQADDKLNVSIYGLVDFGVVSRGGDLAPDGTQLDFASGVSSGSRFGIRANREINSDITALFQAEAGFRTDDGASAVSPNAASNSGPLFGRNVYVGLTGDWGTVVGGRLDGGRATVARNYDPFGEGSVANMSSILLVVTRADNAVAYITPRWNGFGATLAYTTQLIGQEQPGNKGDNRVYAIIPSYENGPLSVTFDHEESWNAKSGAPRLKLSILAGTYDFEVFKLHGFVETVEVEGKPMVDLGDHQAAMLGATIPVGEKGKILMSFLSNQNKSVNSECTKIGIGYQYKLDEAMTLYTTFARINNKENGACTIAYASTQTSYDSGGAGSHAGGYGTRGIDFGISYAF